ncbi:MAG: hypothetical protein JWO40_272 [Candidatus Doudnabacteria bacterium]|nr:hypothetical protein [Candidatus Doudnabacteria bacterium]
MAEINLLQNTNNRNTERKTHNVVNTIGVIVLVVVIGLYGLFFVLTNKADADSKALADQQAQIQQKISTGTQYQQLVSAQTKLKSIESLLKTHTYWCEILPNLSADTLKSTTYGKFTANANGSATISGNVSNFQNLDKLIQGYQVNNDKFVKDVKLVSVSAGSGEKITTGYTLNVTFNQAVLAKYSNTCN